MNPKIKEQWIRALRSGDYLQGQETLRSPKIIYDEDNDYHMEVTFCCLGVLCDLYAKEGRPDFWDTIPYDTSFPPANVLEWAGLEPYDPKKDDPNDPISLIEVLWRSNDGAPAPIARPLANPEFPDVNKLAPAKPFEEIADIIEAFA